MRKLFLAPLVAVFLITGCSTIEKGLFERRTVKVSDAQTNRVAVAVADIGAAVQEAAALGAVVVRTNIVNDVAELVTVIPEQQEVRYVPREAAQAAISIAGQSIPVPGAGIIGMALSGLLSLAAGWKTASARGDRIAGQIAVSLDEYRNKVRSELERFNQDETTKIDPDSFDAKALKALKTSQRAAGYGEQIARIVHKFTAHTSNR